MNQVLIKNNGNSYHDRKYFQITINIILNKIPINKYHNHRVCTILYLSIDKLRAVHPRAFQISLRAFETFVLTFHPQLLSDRSLSASKYVSRNDTELQLTRTVDRSHSHKTSSRLIRNESGAQTRRIVRNKSGVEWLRVEKMLDDELSLRHCSPSWIFELEARGATPWNPICFVFIPTKQREEGGGSGGDFSDGSSCANGSTQLDEQNAIFHYGGIISMDFTVSCSTSWQQYPE